jgi:hypothetical protein
MAFLAFLFGVVVGAVLIYFYGVQKEIRELRKKHNQDKELKK